jgi:predicted NBD/HSP70 family sugar kinase
VEDKWDVVRPTTDSAQGWLRQAKDVARELNAKDLWGVLVSVPGIVDEKSGKVLFSPNVHWSEKTDMAQLISQIWDAPALLVQENRAAALGHLYADPISQDFLLVDFGHGVGGAIIEGGRLFRSPLPLNSEIGHTPIPGNHRQCGCGATGCLETKLSRAGLLNSFVEANRGQPAEWNALLSHVRNHGVRPWLAESLDAAGSVIAGALNVLGLRRVVVTGSMTEMPPQVIQHLAGVVRNGALWGRFGEVVCEGAPRRRIAGLAAAGIDRLLVPADGRRKLGSK